MYSAYARSSGELDPAPGIRRTSREGASRKAWVARRAREKWEDESSIVETVPRESESVRSSN